MESVAILPHVLLTAAHGTIVVWMVRLWRTKQAPGDLLIATICGTIAYDNLIIVAAILTGTESLMETMIGLRWAMHAIFTPFMMIVIIDISAAAGNKFVTRPAVRIAVWATVLLFFGKGVLVDLIKIDMGIPAINALTEGIGAQLATLTTEALILALGIDLWRRRNWPWMFIGGVAMLVAAITRPVVLGMNLGSDGAIILLAAFAFSAAHFAKAGRPDTFSDFVTSASEVGEPETESS